MQEQNRAERAGVTPIDSVPVDSANTNVFRRRRFATFLALIEGLAIRDRPVRILDIGGTRAYWANLRPLWQHLSLELTIVNIGAEDSDDPPYFLRGGDACDLALPDMSFDVVHSNSVIEHVGDWAAMAAMAREVRRLAPHHFVQTPNFWFPLEPHYRTIGFQWLPESTRAALLVRRRFGFCGPEPTFDAAMRNIQAHRLLTRRQMAELFPEGEIRHERVLGLSKSLIAIR